MFRAAARRAERQAADEHNGRAWLAHQTAALIQIALNKPRRFPKLETLLMRGTRKPRRPPQSTEHMKMIAKMWTRSLGGTIAERKRG